MTERLATVQRQLYHEDKLASVGRLAAGVAHEINNPLTGILSYSTLALKRTPPGTETHDELQVIVRETKRCREIVRRLLDFARQALSRKELCDINSAVELSLQILERELANQDITVERNLTVSLPRAYADAGQLQQVFVNLIVNAMDAMEQSPRKVLTVTSSAATLEKGDRVLRVTVADTGSGIPREELHKIFEPFYTTKGTGGTGLGLAVAWGIVEEHQGRIVASSELGKGSAFTVEIPVASERDS